MAVVILNVSEDNGLEYGKGKQVYQLRINYRILCTLEHNFEDGLSSLLREAADNLDETENKVKQSGG